MSKRAVIYARVSTDEQAETNTSISGQLHVCREYAERNEFAVIGEYVEDYTGTTLERPEFNKLQEALAIEQASVVIVLTEDRLSRSYPDTVTLKALWAEQGIELHFTDTGKEEYTFEKMIFSAFRELNAHNEIATFVRRGKKGKDDKVALKKNPVVNANVPYGYTKVGRGHEAKFVINEEEASVVKDIFNWYTVGNGQGPMSLRGIAMRLNEMGIPTPMRRKDGATLWTNGQVKRIQNNEIYAGVFWWGKTRMVKKGFQQRGTPVSQPKEKWIRLDVPELALIDRETFDEVKKRAKRNKELAKRNRKRKYLMSGFFRCGTCGLAVFGYHRNRGHGQDFYSCTSDTKSYLGQSCNRKTKQIVTHKVDKLVWNWLKNLLNDPIALEAGLGELIKQRSEETEPKRARVDKLEELIEESGRRIRRLVNEISKQDDEVVLDALRDEIKMATKSKDSLIGEHARLVEEVSQVEITRDQKEQILEMAAEIANKTENTTYEGKRYIMDILDVRAIMHWEKDARRIEITCAIPMYDDVLWLNKRDCVPSTSIEEILGVTGIGPATFDGIKELYGGEFPVSNFGND